MTSHIELPGLEPDPERPATFSRRIVTDLLRADLGFDGLIYTDSMRMRGVTDLLSAGVYSAALVLFAILIAIIIWVINTIFSGKWHN